MKIRELKGRRRIVGERSSFVHGFLGCFLPADNVPFGHLDILAKPEHNT